jgi:hydroxymethylpyrimidine pyrophosphatase-like HAD family hydrolase
MKELNVRYIIGSNGANIYDFHNKKYLYKSFISGEKINKIMILAKKYKLFCDY